MKNKFRILYAFLGLFLLFSACTPTVNEMGTLIDKSQLKFSITPDVAHPNRIILKSLTPGVTPMWVTPIGRSIRANDTITIAFPGNYKFVYGVESAGGFVQADTFKITISTIDQQYVSGPLWTALSGGFGNEKTWYLDLDANAKSKFFAGPEFFYGTFDNWDIVTNGAKAPSGADSWNWCPDYPGNSWLMPAMNYGSMTFNLKNGAYVSVTNNAIPALGTKSGTYLLDEAAHTLKLTDAGIIHDKGTDGMVKDWGSIRILSMTADHMQLAALRDPVLSGQGACQLVYNFVSKAYYDAH